MVSLPWVTHSVSSLCLHLSGDFGLALGLWHPSEANDSQGGQALGKSLETRGSLGGCGWVMLKWPEHLRGLSAAKKEQCCHGEGPAHPDGVLFCPEAALTPSWLCAAQRRWLHH